MCRISLNWPNQLKFQLKDFLIIFWKLQGYKSIVFCKNQNSLYLQGPNAYFSLKELSKWVQQTLCMLDRSFICSSGRTALTASNPHFVISIPKRSLTWKELDSRSKYEWIDWIPKQQPSSTNQMKSHWFFFFKKRSHKKTKTFALKWFLASSCHVNKRSTTLLRCICNPSAGDLATKTFNKPRLACREKTDI